MLPLTCNDTLKFLTKSNVNYTKFRGPYLYGVRSKEDIYINNIIIVDCKAKRRTVKIIRELLNNNNVITMPLRLNISMWHN